MPQRRPLPKSENLSERVGKQSFDRGATLVRPGALVEQWTSVLNAPFFSTIYRRSEGGSLHQYTALAVGGGCAVSSA